MKNLTLAHIASACGGQYLGEEALKEREIAGAVTDSRQVERDFLFIPIKGQRVDGHDFIPSVFAKGALATLSERPLKACPGPCILVDSCQQALRDIAAYYRSQLDIPIVGITGSVGKTSTKEMIAAVLSTRYRVLKTEGNFNNEIGLPLTILKIRREHEAAVVEMGISDFGEMHRLAAIARPDILVITNIGTCHLENLGDRDGVLRAKTEVLAHMKPGSPVILNGDDDKLRTITSACGKAPLFYGMGGAASEGDCGRRAGGAASEGDCGRGAGGVASEGDCGRGAGGAACPGSLSIYMDACENLGLRGTRARLHTPKGDIAVEIPIPGAHNLYNAMAAAGVGLSLGLTLSEIAQGISNAKTISGRTNLVEAGGVLIIDDCYNANPMSMRASLDVLKNALGRTIAVLGDMGELGTEEKRLHYEVGAYAARAGIDLLFCVGTLSREMERGARETLAQDGGKSKSLLSGEEKPGQAVPQREEKSMGIFHFDTREELLPELLAAIRKGDTVLVKASHFMDFPKIVEALKRRL